MTDSDKDNDIGATKEPIKPPMPDVPVSDTNPIEASDTTSSRPASEQAQKKMAEEIQSGRTPYDYTAELKSNRSTVGVETEVERPRSGFSLINALVLTIIGLLVAAGFAGWTLIKDISTEIKSMNTSVEQIAERIAQEARINQKTAKAVTRAELVRSLAALEEVIAMGNPELKQRAEALRVQILEALTLLSDGGASSVKAKPIEKPQVEPSPTPIVEPVIAEPKPAQPTPDKVEKNKSEDKQPNPKEPIELKPVVENPSAVKEETTSPISSDEGKDDIKLMEEVSPFDVQTESQKSLPAAPSDKPSQ